MSHAAVRIRLAKDDQRRRPAWRLNLEAMRPGRHERRRRTGDVAVIIDRNLHALLHRQNLLGFGNDDPSKAVTDADMSLGLAAEIARLRAFGDMHRK
jgi:hypothetical protein